MKENIYTRFVPHNLTSIVSLLCFTMSFILAGFYYFSQYETLHWQVMIVGLILLLPYLLSAAGYAPTGTILLCFMAPWLPFYLSVTNKIASLDYGLINPVNYFDVRLLIISSILVPMTTIPLSKRRMLIGGLLPSFIALSLYDPIHNSFGVGYYDTGLKSNDYYFSANLYSGFAYVFLGAAFAFLKYTIEKGWDKELLRRNRLEKYMTDLMAIGNSPYLMEGKTEEIYKDIGIRLRQSLTLHAVKIWEYDREKRELVNRFSLTDKTENPGELLPEAQYQAYFDKISKEKILVSGEAGQQAGQLKSPYLDRHGITSFVDVIFMTHNMFSGVLSCEVKGAARSWSIEDSLYVKAMGDMLSLVHANRIQIDRNEELENRVADRTAALRETNKELKEYAFLNSHILRAPVARVFGMYQVIHAEYGPVLRPEILVHFKTAIEELDAITRRLHVETEELSGHNK